MEDAKLQALHDTLSQIRGKKGLGTNNQYSWQRTSNGNGTTTTTTINRHPAAIAAQLPDNALYANFVPEGVYDPKNKKRNHHEGDGRIVKRDFSDAIYDKKNEEDHTHPSNNNNINNTTVSHKLEKQQRKEARKAEKKAAKKAEKMKVKRDAKIQEKKRQRKIEKETQRTPQKNTGQSALSSVGIDHVEETSPMKTKTKKKSLPNTVCQSSDLMTNKNGKKRAAEKDKATTREGKVDDAKKQRTKK
jgi:hypothetical protein